VLILGGGYIALEFANIFSGLGSEVRIIHRGDRMLRGFDDDLRAHMHIESERVGIKLSMKTTISKIEAIGPARRATLSSGETVEADAILYAIGRDPNTAGLGLERAGVKTDEAGAVIVDEFSRSGVESVYAIGDVTNRMNLTPVAIRDGHAFADTVFNNRPTPVDHRTVPSAVFGRPPIGTVGLTEADARRSHEAVDVYRTNFRPMRTVFVGSEQRTLMKLVVDAKTDQLLGVHIAGTDAPEMIQLAAVAVKAGLTKKQWDSTVALHPTAAEELVLMREKVGPPGSAG
jgi:glutathione reductase (NADPH)